MRRITRFYRDHGTKLLGTLQTIVAGFVTVQGLIKPEHLPYWSAANIVLGALTIGRGFANTRTQQKP